VNVLRTIEEGNNSFSIDMDRLHGRLPHSGGRLPRALYSAIKDSIDLTICSI